MTWHYLTTISNILTSTASFLTSICNQRNRNPRPQLEPQITSLDKCNINLTIAETHIY